MNPAPASPMPDSQSPIHVPPPLPPSKPAQPSDPTQFGEPPLSSEPAAPVLPPRKLPPIREVFDPIQPIDLLSFAKQAAPERFADPELAGQFAAAVDELRSLLEEKKFSSRPPAPPTVCLGDVPSRNVDWLWPDRVPIGKITLLVGDPGVGKSLIALDIAARVTTGRAWPDCQPPALPGVFEPTRAAESNSADQPTRAASDVNIAFKSEAIDNANTTTDPRQSRGLPGERASDSVFRAPGSVLLLSAEDDLSDTVRPRLEALDADCSRVIALTSVPATKQPPCEAGPPPASPTPHPASSQFDLGRDVALLDRTLDSHPDCSLVIIDPISAYLGRGVENVNAEVRRIIAPLAELAARRRLAIVVISHLRKQQGAAIHRSMGSLAFVAAARTAWLVTKDSKTDVNYTPERRLMLPIKNNIAADTAGLVCSIETHPAAGLPIVHWSTESLDIDADAALTAFSIKDSRPAEERRDASRWLRSQLASGPLPTNEISEAAAAHGFSIGTLRRAFRDLGGVAVKTGYGTTGKWFWHLPA